MASHWPHGQHVCTAVVIHMAASQCSSSTVVMGAHWSCTHGIGSTVTMAVHVAGHGTRQQQRQHAAPPSPPHAALFRMVRVRSTTHAHGKTSLCEASRFPNAQCGAAYSAHDSIGKNACPHATAYFKTMPLAVWFFHTAVVARYSAQSDCAVGKT